MSNPGTKALTGSMEVKLGWSNLLTKPDGREIKDEDTHKVSVNFAAGIAAGQVDESYSDTFIVSNASPFMDFDLIGVLEDVFGFVVNAAKIVAILVENRSAERGQLIRVGGAGAGNNAWTAPFAGSSVPADATIDAGASSCIYLGNHLDGYDVVAGSSDVLRVENVLATDDITFRISFLGRTS